MFIIYIPSLARGWSLLSDSSHPAIFDNQMKKGNKTDMLQLLPRQESAGVSIQT